MITTRITNWGQILSGKLKLVFKLDVSAIIFGLGYIIGLKYALIICTGSFLSWFVILPLIFEFGQHITLPFGTLTTKLIADMTPEEIFRTYVCQIGIGGIAMAGIIGVIRSSKIIVGAFPLAYKEIVHHKSNNLNTIRTQTDIRMLWVTTLIILTALAIFAFFAVGVVPPIRQAIVALLVVTIISFLFTTVAANATAIVGTNPVSGMTLMTLLLSSLVLTQIGLSGNA